MDFDGTPTPKVYLFMKIVIIGSAGGIGQALSLLLKGQLGHECQLWLHDLDEKNIGVAHELTHIPSHAQISSSFGTDLSASLTHANIVIIAAGKPRTGQIERRDLLSSNCEIIFNIISSYARYCPNAFLGIITNPINCIIPFVSTILTHFGVFDFRKLFGITTLDLIRAESLFGKKIQVVGGHCQQTILPLISQAPETAIDQKQFREALGMAGNKVVELKKGNGSATLSMAYAASLFIHNLIRALKGDLVAECAFVYDPNDACSFFSKPFVLSHKGINSFIPLSNLSAFEREEIERISKTLEQDCRLGVDMAIKIIGNNSRLLQKTCCDLVV